MQRTDCRRPHRHAKHPFRARFRSELAAERRTRPVRTPPSPGSAGWTANGRRFFLVIRKGYFGIGERNATRFNSAYSYLPRRVCVGSRGHRQQMLSTGTMPVSPKLPLSLREHPPILRGIFWRLVGALVGILWKVVGHVPSLAAELLLSGLIAFPAGSVALCFLASTRSRNPP